MNDLELITIAKKYLKLNNISYAEPISIGERQPDRIEVIFTVPEALNPNLVIDPPDIRVWVNIRTKEVTWIPQM